MTPKKSDVSLDKGIGLSVFVFVFGVVVLVKHYSLEIAQSSVCFVVHTLHTIMVVTE